jgi:hypothetical protein
VLMMVLAHRSYGDHAAIPASRRSSRWEPPVGHVGWEAPVGRASGRRVKSPSQPSSMWQRRIDAKVWSRWYAMRFKHGQTELCDTPCDDIDGKTDGGRN